MGNYLSQAEARQSATSSLEPQCRVVVHPLLAPTSRPNQSQLPSFERCPVETLGFPIENSMAFGLKFAVSVATLVCLAGFVSSNEDIADGEDGYMDTAVERAVIESCAG